MLKICLLSPKGLLYRHRGGIFPKSLRYSPLTLPTLAALIPDDIEHELKLFDEGIEEIPPDLEADRIGITVVLGGPHVILVPDDAVVVK